MRGAHVFFFLWMGRRNEATTMVEKEMAGGGGGDLLLLLFLIVFALAAASAVLYACHRKTKAVEGFFSSSASGADGGLLEDVKQRKVSAEDRKYSAKLRGRVGEPNTFNASGQDLVRRIVDGRMLHSDRPPCTVAGVRMPLRWRPDESDARVCRLNKSYVGAAGCKRDNADLFDANVLKDVTYEDQSQTCRLTFKEGLTEADMRAYKQKVDPFAAKEKRKRELIAEKERLEAISRGLAADIARLKKTLAKLKQKIFNLRWKYVRPYEKGTERLLEARKFPGALKILKGEGLSTSYRRIAPKKGGGGKDEEKKDKEEDEYEMLVFEEPGKKYRVEVTADVVEMDVLVVAGGGSGGLHKGGGGGGGGVVMARKFTAMKGVWEIRVGKGGKPPNNQSAVGLRGEDSYFGFLVAIGGGGGGSDHKPPTSTGGSGGGGRMAANNFYKYGEFDEKVGYDGNDVGKSNVETKEACADKCAADDRCEGLTYRKDDGRCFKKDQLNPRGRDTNMSDNYVAWKKIDMGITEGGRATQHKIGFGGVESFGHDGSQSYDRTPFPGGGGAGGQPGSQGSGGPGKSFADLFGTELGDQGFFGGGGSGMPEKGVNETGGKGGGGNGRSGSVGGAGKPGTGGGGGGAGKGDGENGGGSGVVVLRYKLPSRK